MKFLYPLITTFTLIIYASLILAQQLYIGDPEAACNNNSNTAIYIGYSCSGAISCKTYLTFRSQYPYNTLSAIASLLTVDVNDIAQANSNYNTGDVVEWNDLLYVPVDCSCGSNSYYSKITTRTVSLGDSYFYIANYTYQGLATCQAIQVANNLNPSNLVTGQNIKIPLRCACPTTNQLSSGVNSLFSYVVGKGDTISSISAKLKVDSGSILEDNQLSENSIIYPFTTLLIPVRNNQSTSALTPDTNNQSTFKKANTKKIVRIVLVVLGVLGLVGLAVSIKLILNFCSNSRCCDSRNCCSNISLSCCNICQRTNKGKRKENVSKSNNDKRKVQVPKTNNDDKRKAQVPKTNNDDRRNAQVPKTKNDDKRKAQVPKTNNDKRIGERR